MSSEKPKSTSLRKIRPFNLFNKVSSYPFLYHIAVSVDWKKLWDRALDHGSSVIKSMKKLGGVITYPDHVVSKCPLCDISKLDQITLAEHFTDEHTKKRQLMDYSDWLSDHHGPFML